MKVPVSRVEVKVQWEKVGGKTLSCNEVRKYPKDDSFEVVVSETDMHVTDIGKWLEARGWYYAGHKAGIMTWARKCGAPAIMMETEQTPLRYR
jgi:hypothetical protein